MNTKEEEKYWSQRHRLWSKYDDGIQMDDQSWYSVSPEAIAQHIARKAAEGIRRSRGPGAAPPTLIIDAFCGAGGNAIQFAKYFDRVIAIDIDSTKIELAKKNAAVYGVASKIEFLTRDFFEAVKTGLRADAIFLAPPWGGPLYHYSAYYDLNDTLPSTPDILKAAGTITQNIILYMPRHVRVEQLTRMAKLGQCCEVEHNFINDKCKSCTAYYGDLVDEAKGGVDGERRPTDTSQETMTQVAKLCVSKRRKL